MKNAFEFREFLTYLSASSPLAWLRFIVNSEKNKEDSAIKFIAEIFLPLKFIDKKQNSRKKAKSFFSRHHRKKKRYILIQKLFLIAIPHEPLNVQKIFYMFHNVLIFEGSRKAG